MSVPFDYLTIVLYHTRPQIAIVKIDKDFGKISSDLTNLIFALDKLGCGVI